MNKEIEQFINDVESNKQVLMLEYKTLQSQLEEMRAKVGICRLIQDYDAFAYILNRLAGDALSSDEKSMMWLYFSKGEKVIDIADRFNISATYASRIIRRCVRSLYSKPMDVIERLEYQESIIEGLLIRNYKLHCAVTNKRKKTKKPDFDFEILETAKLLNTSIYIFDPTPRINRFCKDAKFETLRDIVQFTPKELKSKKKFGMYAIREVEEMLTKLGLHLGMDVSMYPDLNQLHQEAKTRRNSKGRTKSSYD